MSSSTTVVVAVSLEVAVSLVAAVVLLIWTLGSVASESASASCTSGNGGSSPLVGFPMLLASGRQPQQKRSHRCSLLLAISGVALLLAAGGLIRWFQLHPLGPIDASGGSSDANLMQRGTNGGSEEKQQQEAGVTEHICVPMLVQSDIQSLMASYLSDHRYGRDATNVEEEDPSVLWVDAERRRW